jgi:hypothetical protein
MPRILIVEFGFGQGRKLSVLIAWRRVWLPEPVWTLRRKVLLLPAFEPKQRIARRYTDWAIATPRCHFDVTFMPIFRTGDRLPTKPEPFAVDFNWYCSSSFFRWLGTVFRTLHCSLSRRKPCLCIAVNRKNVLSRGSNIRALFSVPFIDIFLFQFL